VPFLNNQTLRVLVDECHHVPSGDIPVVRSAPNLTKRPLRVLLIEDNEADADLIVHTMLQANLNTHVDVAATRRQFTELLAGPEYDLVLADYSLPDWTGMEALRELRRLGIDIPFIIVTGALGDERAVECVKAGAADYVLKGSNLARLPIAANRAIEEKRARDELLRAHQLMEDVQQEGRERETRFRQFADNMDEVFFVLDGQNMRALYINPAYEKIWGRSCQSLYDDPESFVEPVPTDDRERFGDYMGRVQRGEHAGKLEFRVIQPNGNVRWLLAHAVPILNEQGEVYRISGVALDITESREAHLALEESAERFRLLTDASFDGIAISQAGVLQEVNQGFLKMFGYGDMEEVIGRPITAFVAEESVAEVDGRNSDGIEGTYEHVGLHKDGKKLVLEATARLHKSGGRPARITALRDMTERRALEDQFRQAQKMEAVGRLAGGVAHDFNNLLTVILSYTDMLIAGVSPKDPRVEDLGEIRNAAITAGSLTRQLLAFSRQQVIEPRVVILEDVVNQTHKLLKRLIGEDIDLATQFAAAPSVVHIDPGQLEQVLMNLAVNARDAMPTGGKLTIETGVVELDENYAAAHWPATRGRFAMVAVSDTGIGMDEATQARMFEPFFTTKGPGKGTGLGLATVYGIVKQSGGFIWVYSEPGKGATFKIYLPLYDDAPTTASEERKKLPAVRGTETVLLVEDSEDVRYVARKSLERQGYEVIDAPSASAALTLAAQLDRPVHLLLTDVVMPEMSGRVLAEKFATLHPKAKVLYMSGYTDDAIIRHGVLLAKTALLQKPFTPLALATRVREVLDT
jgi:two-component system cell cycle sensor histidine kinase/response regulator CckA